MHKSYQVIIASPGSHDIWYGSLAFPYESHKLKDDPGVMVHLVN